MTGEATAIKAVEAVMNTEEAEEDKAEVTVAGKAAMSTVKAVKNNPTVEVEVDVKNSTAEIKEAAMAEEEVVKKNTVEASKEEATAAAEEVVKKNTAEDNNNNNKEEDTAAKAANNTTVPAAKVKAKVATAVVLTTTNSEALCSTLSNILAVVVTRACSPLLSDTSKATSKTSKTRISTRVRL